MPRKEKVTKVIDGYSFLTDKRKNAVRLATVDTPEQGEPGYRQAKSKLAGLIWRKEVTIDTKARDSHGRSVANVKLGQKSVNKEMKKYEKK